MSLSSKPDWFNTLWINGLLIITSESFKKSSKPISSLITSDSNGLTNSIIPSTPTVPSPDAHIFLRAFVVFLMFNASALLNHSVLSKIGWPNLVCLALYCLYCLSNVWTNKGLLVLVSILMLIPLPSNNISIALLASSLSSWETSSLVFSASVFVVDSSWVSL